LALLALAFSWPFLTNSVLMLSMESIMALADLETVMCVKLYWFLHTGGSEARITLARVASLKVMFPNSVEATALGLFLMVGINPPYERHAGRWCTSQAS
jgi:hypothetical protein